MSINVNVTFTIQDNANQKLMDWLYESTSAKGTVEWMHGYRSDGRNISSEAGALRSALSAFASEMEMVLKAHDHKTGWRLQPVPALTRLLELELQEFKVAYDYFTVAEARKELIDVANYCMIVWDRLGMLDQGIPVREQVEAPRG